MLFALQKFWNHYSFTVPSVVAQFPNLSFPIVQLEVLPIAELFRTLENAGEIGVSIALHTIDQEGRGVAKVKPCCFVLDAPKEKTLKKKAGLHNMLNQLTEFWKEKLCEQHSIRFQFLTSHLTRWDPLLHSEPGSTWQRSGIAPISRSAGVSCFGLSLAFPHNWGKGVSPSQHTCLFGNHHCIFQHNGEYYEGFPWGLNFQ